MGFHLFRAGVGIGVGAGVGTGIGTGMVFFLRAGEAD